MIQKLRRKFVLINMSLVFSVLLIVFSVFLYTNYQRLENTSKNDMKMALTRTSEKTPPKFEIGGSKPQDLPPTTPIVCAVLDSDGEILKTVGQNAEISQQVLEQAVQQALEANTREGTISSLDLRFLRQDMPSGVKIAFADRSHERDSIRSLLLSALLVGAGGLFAFFLISLYLARWALRPVERAWEQQRQFVADASHELKTPLTVILANIGILLSHRESTIEQQLKWVEYTGTEATRMKQLVDDLLFLAKSDARRMPPPQTPVDLSNIAWSSLLPYESVAFEQGVTLNSSIAPNLFILGDSGRLQQLIVILLDNACKYAGEHGVVTLTLEQVQSKARLMVNNTGALIPMDQLEQIFERFYRLDQSRARKTEGYGLGLSIAKTIVEAHGGKISAVSSAGAGTSFIVTLPLQP
ncbi:cell wall metabolism sensor histidine kinase WalK [Faecalispora jeddahensis]|uniref:sensor histidine kinase n=1 Tax=Faecalispora jeddahensis TaxID=1414721 RepID=UPI0027B98762|nr:HAMP domain-containing sensor histidine kinase [Faecalispora jeddahensis]